ncbi:MAG: bifunctional acetate--CoA ligase family protein/GNAT family N-acetyltransferase [Candidatus Promineifilaceae bacterium]|jgi:acetyltransferase
MSDLTRGTSHNVLRYTGNPLDVMFSPRSVAVIGASERPGSIGRTILTNLLESPYEGRVYAVNPEYRSVLGLPSYNHVGLIEEPIDLAVVATPGEVVPEVVRQCVDAGVKSAVLISAGFRETGARGAALEAAVLAEAKKGSIRLVGPNCMGIMNPYNGLNATFASRMALKGNVGFASQSGALFTAIVDWSIRENVGISSFISTGSMMDVDWGDLIYYFGDDPRTKSILIYMETIGDARSFMSAAREVALTKPIIVMKPGRSPEAARAAAAHTGVDAGNDLAVSAAFRRCGVLRVNTIDELFSLAEVLAKQPRPLGPRLTIVTNAGGPGVSATDALVAAGGKLAPLSDSLMAALDEALPAHWSRNNPIDLLGDAGAKRYKEAISIVSKDSESDGLLAILTPQGMTEPVATAEALKALYDRPAGYPYGKPVLASWMGGEDVAEGTAVLNKANIPTFDYPDTAARIFTYMWRYQRRLSSLYETPTLPVGDDEESLKRFLTGELIAGIRENGRTRLTGIESKRILEAYGIPVIEEYLVHSADKAVARAEDMGYPVVLRAYTTDEEALAPVQLRLKDEGQVRGAYLRIETMAAEGSGFAGAVVQPFLNMDGEFTLQLASYPDAQLGPILKFGLGGNVGRLVADIDLGLPPLNSILARRMMERTAVYEAMYNTGTIDMSALENLLVRFSYLVAQQPWIKTITIDPLLILHDAPMVFKAAVELYGLDVQKEELPRLAVRPYPTQYVEEFTNREGIEFVIRPIRPEDEPLMADFQARLSEESVYMRYFRAFELSDRVAHERLTRLCHVDYDRTIALVITWQNPDTAEPEIVAAGRLTRMPDPQEAEFAILVRDDFQGKGLGTVLLTRLLQVGRDEGIDRVIAYMLATNLGMIKVCKKLGFRFEREDDLVKAIIDLDTFGREKAAES